MDDYLNVSRFLPKLNNEILGERNDPYKERLSSLENLVLIMVRLTKPEISFLIQVQRLHGSIYT